VSNDGWLGPPDTLSGWESGHCNDHGGAVNGTCGVSWAPFRFLTAAIQYAEAFPMDRDRTVSSLWSFASKLLRVLRTTPLRDEWAVNRWQEPVLALEWLLDHGNPTDAQVCVCVCVCVRACVHVRARVRVNGCFTRAIACAVGWVLSQSPALALSHAQVPRQWRMLSDQREICALSPCVLVDWKTCSPTLCPWSPILHIAAVGCSNTTLRSHRP
jgi:hypothetical protein